MTEDIKVEETLTAGDAVEVKQSAEEAAQEEVTKSKKGRATNSQKLKAQEEQMAKMQEQIQLLTNALLAERSEKRLPPEEEVKIPVVRIGGPALSMFLRDAHGDKQHFTWDRKGEVQHLTEKQFEEAMATPGAKKFFDRDFLAVEGEEPRFMGEPDAFMNNLEIGEVDEVVRSIEDTAYLLRLLNHLENMRVVTEDEGGKPLLDKEGMPYAEVKALTAKHRMIAEAVIQRIHELTQVRYSLSDPG